MRKQITLIAAVVAFIAALLYMAIGIPAFAFERENMSIRELTTDTIKGGRSTDSVTVKNPVTAQKPVTLQDTLECQKKVTFKARTSIIKSSTGVDLTYTIYSTATGGWGAHYKRK